jgi:dTDP-L-rhamnose 4-epimerase
MTRALVTGGAGLIGSHVVDALRAEQVDVVVLDSLVSPTHEGRPDWLRPDVEYVFADIRDRCALAGAFRGVEVLFHLAAFGGFAPGLSEYFDMNVTAYATMLEVASEAGAPLERAVVASSQAVYGEGSSRCERHGVFHPRPRSVALLDQGKWEVTCPRCGRCGSPVATPEEALDPMTPYALSKHCLEWVALKLGEARGIPTTALRFALTYGPRQSATNPYCGIVAIFSQRMLRGDNVLVYEDGAQTRDFVHVEDVARAHVAVAFDPRSHGQVLNVGTGVGTSVLDVISELGALLEVEAQVWMPGWYRPGEVRHLRTDAAKLLALGWQPRVGLGDGLEDYVDWMRTRPLCDDPMPLGIARMRESGVIREVSTGSAPQPVSSAPEQQKEATLDAIRG